MFKEGFDKKDQCYVLLKWGYQIDYKKVRREKERKSKLERVNDWLKRKSSRDIAIIKNLKKWQKTDGKVEKRNNIKWKNNALLRENISFLIFHLNWESMQILSVSFG